MTFSAPKVGAEVVIGEARGAATLVTDPRWLIALGGNTLTGRLVGFRAASDAESVESVPGTRLDVRARTAGGRPSLERPWDTRGWVTIRLSWNVRGPVEWP